ncbi:amidohydrolase [Streptomyces sp. NA04227]|uniref:amidohydrolase n=1 Tax=Streptomyces sp. NA04227 TaxID=2742136 RepID=UPI00158FA7F7|nr:amidohydrolase [Streptomyces sp. NA04227]QKW05492.1 amidohydrolase [Streptomyces sp. NA04227]
MNAEAAPTKANGTVLGGLAAVLRPLTAFCLDVHRHPELSGAEERTADRFASFLKDAHLETTGGVGGTGVVAVLENGPGPTVLLRAELDALPGREETGLPYASQCAAVHSCGHDLHLSAVAGAAALLARQRQAWRGTLVVLGQPAEETLEGARAVLADGLYTRFPPPDAVLAQHTAPLPGGMVAHAYGPMTAGSVTLRVVVHGRGGHAGAPHLAVDPVLAAASVVTRVQGVVARECAPSEQVAVTVGSFHAGQRASIIPDSAELGLTVRAVGPESLARATAAVERVIRAECTASGCPREPDIERVSASPTTHPDPAATARVREAHVRRFGPERVAMWPPSLATEDFALYGDAGHEVHGRRGIALSYWMLGAVGAADWARAPGTSAAEKMAALPSNHSPRFSVDVRTALPTGVEAMVTAAMEWLRPG